MVLEMFVGDVDWASGTLARHVLEDRLQKGAFRPPMPEGVIALLRRCFEADPQRRPKDMLEVAGELQRIYRQVTGREYPGPTPQFPQRERRGLTHDRRTTGGVSWDDPRWWLERALRAAERLMPQRSGSRQAQAVADLAVYDEAKRIYERLIAQGRDDVREKLATLLVNKAFVHENLGDGPGALEMYDQAIEIRERLVHREGKWELANDWLVEPRMPSWARRSRSKRPSMRTSTRESTSAPKGRCWICRRV